MFSSTRISKLTLYRIKYDSRSSGQHLNNSILKRCRFSTSEPHNQTRNSSIIGRVKSIPPNGYFLLMFPCITLYLGVWQIRRRKWKLALIEEMDRKRKLPGVEVPERLSSITTDREYEAFILKGEFDHSRETFIGPRSLLDDSSAGGLISSSEGIGVHVITPMKLSHNGEEVLVNRGWISMKHKRQPDTIHRPQGEQRLVAVYRGNESGSLGNSQASYDSRTDMWNRRDINLLSNTLGTQAVFFDESMIRDRQIPPGSPIPGQTAVQLRNEHLSYIITWLSLTVILMVIWCRRFLRPRDYLVEDLLNKAEQLKYQQFKRMQSQQQQRK